MLPNVTVVAFSLLRVYSTLLALLPTATAPKLMGPNGDNKNPPDTEVPSSDVKLLPFTLLPKSV